MQGLKPSDIEAYYSYKTLAGLGGNTIQRHHANSRKCLKSAQKDELIVSDPATLADMLSKTKAPITYYLKADLLILLKCTRSLILYPIILLACLGLRRSELLAVHWSSIDFELGTLTVCSKIVPLKGESASYQTILKTKSSYRVLSIPTFILAELRFVYDRQSMEFQLNPQSYNTNYLAFVCIDTKGKLVTPDRASAMMLQVVKRYQLRPITLHGLRHTCATMISQLGYNLKYIQEWLGHSTITVAANTYLHIDISEKRAVSNSMQENIFASIG